jgi:hypothetical protein
MRWSSPDLSMRPSIFAVETAYLLLLRRKPTATEWKAVLVVDLGSDGFVLYFGSMRTGLTGV